MSVKVLIIHGPNLDLLGDREIEVYGKITLDDINSALKKLSNELGANIEIVQFSSEGDIIKKIGSAKKEGQSALIINPAGYTHYSVAIRDAIAAVNIPTIEVHISNIYSREEFRQTSVVSAVAKGVISGFGLNSYLLGLRAAVELTRKSN